VDREAFLAHWRERAAALGRAPSPEAVTRETLDAHDPTGEMRRRVAVVSLGNACEAHGPALAPDVDDRVGAVVATRVAAASGARYLGHAPFATDRVGAVAARWSPEYLAPEVFVDRLAGFVDGLLAAFYDAAGAPRPALIAFVSGHGGNGALQEHLEDLAGRLSVEACAYHLAFTQDALRPGVDAQHAGAGEHAVAAALGPGTFSRRALDAQNAALAEDEGLVDTLRAHPALGGMAGFYLFGDEAFDPIRARYPGVKTAVRDLVETRRIEADAAVGAELLDASVRGLVRWLWGLADELSIARPRA